MITQSAPTTTIIENSDYIGMTGGTLCLIHCLATPFIFAAQATTSTACSEISPTWWKMIDVLFLVITFAAVYYTSKTTSLKWMPSLLYFFWFSFLLLLINNLFHITGIPHSAIYIPAISLSLLHLYNRYYCTCLEDKCCLGIKDVS